MISLKRGKKSTSRRRSPSSRSSGSPVFRRYTSKRSESERTRRDEKLVQDKPPGSSKKRFFERSLYAIGLLVFIVGSIFLSSLTSSPDINVISKAKASAETTDQYATLAAQAANQGFKGYSKLTINRTNIIDELQSKHPEIELVKVRTPIFRQSALVEITLAEPVLQLKSSNGDFLVDSRGIALASATEGQNNSSQLVAVNDDTNTDIKVGEPALTSQQVGFIQELKRQSDAKNIQIDEILLTGGGGELRVRLAGIKYFVKYSVYEDPRKSFGTFIAAMDYLEQGGKGAPPSEYIDVRIPERAYVK